MNISSKDIENELINYLKKGNPQIIRSDDVPKDISLVELGYLDSFGIIDLITYFENKWNIKINNDEITPEHFGSIKKMVYIFERKINK